MHLYLFLSITLLFLAGNPGHSQTCHPDPTTRTRVTDATQAPYRYICALEVYREKAREPKRSTGFLVSPRLILTAGHTVLQKRRRIKRITIRPFVNGTVSSNTSFTYNGVELGLLIDPDYGRPKHKSSNDYGAIKLPNDTLFRFTKGHFVWKENNQYLNDGEYASVQLAGYPCDKAAYEMFEQKGTIHKLGEQYLEYDLYTRRRNSGSPVWITVNEQPVVIGIHNSGGDKATKKNKCKTPRQKNCNKGVRINKVVYDRITSWMN